MDSTRINKKFFRVVDVWKIHDQNSAKRYRCFELLDDKKYCVQSCDYFSHPIDDDQIRVSERQFIELFIETPPDTRNVMYSSLEEAIEVHEREFGEDR